MPNSSDIYDIKTKSLCAAGVHTRCPGASHSICYRAAPYDYKWFLHHVPATLEENYTLHYTCGRRVRNTGSILYASDILLLQLT